MATTYDDDAPDLADGEYAPRPPAGAWEQARLRHRLARHGLIPWHADPVPVRPGIRRPFEETAEL